ncbi:MAG: hypothetical protein Kow00124_32420 [Anaerolineae bacterium]
MLPVSMMPQWIDSAIGCHPVMMDQSLMIDGAGGMGKWPAGSPRGEGLPHNKRPLRGLARQGSAVQGE